MREKMRAVGGATVHWYYDRMIGTQSRPPGCRSLALFTLFLYDFRKQQLTMDRGFGSAVTVRQSCRSGSQAARR